MKKQKTGSSQPGAKKELPFIPPHEPPHDQRSLAAAIFNSVDPVIIGVGLLQAESESVRARVWETLVHFAFDRPSARDGEQVRLVWDLPGPPSEPPSP